MKKHEREELQETLAGNVLIEVQNAIAEEDFDTANKLMKLYNKLDRGW